MIVKQLLAANQNRLIKRFTSETELPTHLLYRDRTTIILDFINGQATRARAGTIKADLLEYFDIRVPNPC